jgi:hypothetical protein
LSHPLGDTNNNESPNKKAKGDPDLREAAFSSRFRHGQLLLDQTACASGGHGPFCEFMENLESG